MSKLQETAQSETMQSRLEEKNINLRAATSLLICIFSPNNFRNIYDKKLALSLGVCQIQAMLSHPFSCSVKACLAFATIPAPYMAEARVWEFGYGTFVRADGGVRRSLPHVASETFLPLPRIFTAMLFDVLKMLFSHVLWWWCFFFSFNKEWIKDIKLYSGTAGSWE